MNNYPEMKSCESYWVKIYIAGDIVQIEQICRQYCFHLGFCVTVTPTKFIYTGGEETGAEIGIMNYARFPTTPDELSSVWKSLSAEERKTFLPLKDARKAEMASATI